MPETITPLFAASQVIRGHDGLRLSTHRLPERGLWSLWRALDENENGFICAGEWGRFMRAHTTAAASVDVEQAEKVCVMSGRSAHACMLIAH